MNDPQSFSTPNTPPDSSPLELDNHLSASISTEKPAGESSSDKDVSTLFAEKAGEVAQKASRIVGQISEHLTVGRNRLISASRRSPQGAALTMLGVGIGTGIGCGILLSSLFSRNRGKNRAESPLAG